MKHMIRILTAAAAAIAVLAGCSSVKRVSPDTVTDLSGYWNDTDVRIVADSLITDCLNAPAIARYTAENGRLPVVIVGSFTNDSDEHIDTGILTTKLEAALVNSGKVDFVADASTRMDLRAEREAQQAWASEETAKSLANETGADFMLVGSVKTIVDSYDNETTRTYQVSAELIDIETNRKLWIGINDEIKKFITRSSARF